MDLTFNEIKKELYKRKPNAYRYSVGNEYTLYDCTLSFPVRKDIQVFFKIPNEECRDFNHCESAQLLIRWYSYYIVI